MNAEILSIGDELLIGQVINTNQAYIAEQLNRVGILVDRMSTVGDIEGDILQALAEAFTTHDVVTVTGGLGPTHDDITRAAVCSYFKTDLVRDQASMERIERVFARRNLPMLPRNRDQAMVPRGCTVIPNALGTAPGYFFNRKGKYCIVLPGVPYEMESMMAEFVIPYFERHPTGAIIRHRTLKTTGIAESVLAERIGPVQDLFRNHEGTTLAFLPGPTGVRLRITVRASTRDEAEQQITHVESVLRERAGKYLYGADEEEIEEVVGRLLAERHLTIAVAESCTGGLIADRITNVPGSSRYFERGIVVYSNASKLAELGVPSALIEQHGAVSKPVAEAMALGIRTKSNADIGISTTGIAGPTGGSAEKPVGLVWIGYSDCEGTLALEFYYGEDRRRIKERASQAALDLVRRRLLRIE